MNFKKLEILDLSINKITSIKIFEKVDFKELRVLNFYSNNISSTKILDKIEFKKLEKLDIRNNKIDLITNLPIINNLLSRINLVEFIF